MNQTIAFLTPSIGDHREGLAELSREFDLLLQTGFEYAHEFVKEGIKIFIDQEIQHSDIFFLVQRADQADGWFFQEELLKFRENGVEPSVFNFLRRVSEIISTDSAPSYFIFADEWERDDEALFLTGSIDQLIGFLTLTKSLDLPLWQPGTGRIQESPRYPIVFEIPPVSRQTFPSKRGWYRARTARR